MFNSMSYTKTFFDANKFLANTKNKYRVVGQKPYLDKSGKAGKQGVTLTLQIVEDVGDYGLDKEGNKRPTNLFENFEATILNGQTKMDLNKGDYVSLGEFDQEHSYVINYDVILRFRSCKKVGG